MGQCPLDGCKNQDRYGQLHKTNLLMPQTLKPVKTIGGVLFAKISLAYYLYKVPTPSAFRASKIYINLYSTVKL